jgi:AcrR family transcriptional regulator
MVRAAVDEFAARGYHNTSIEDIVRKSRCSRTAFYMFFDNRADAMYAALHFCLHHLLDTIRTSVKNAEAGESPIEVVVRSFVEFLVADPSAATIVLMEAAPTSPEVSALRSRKRLEFADLLLGLKSGNDQSIPAAADAIRVGIVGLLWEPMAHLAETNRLAEAPAYIPTLVTAVERHFR